MLRGRTAGFGWAQVIGWIALLMLPISPAAAQAFPPLFEQPANGLSDASGRIGGQKIADIQIVGNRQVNLQEIRAEMDSRPGQVLDTLKIQRDKKKLAENQKNFMTSILKLSLPIGQVGWL